METNHTHTEELPVKADLALKESSDASVFGSASSFEHAQRVAKMLATSNLIPENYRNNIQNTMIALEMANRIGASPLMVMQNLYIVQGKPSWSSTFIISAINACKRFSPLRFELTGKEDDFGCTAWAYDLSSNEKLEGPRVTIKMAKDEGWFNKNGSKWKTMPELMIRYRAAAFFGRLYAPDILMGMHTMEEAQDVSYERIETPAIEELQTLYDFKKAILTPDEQKSVERILTNKEEKSYLKLHKFLQAK